LPYDARAADLFQVVSRRYERKSVLVWVQESRRTWPSGTGRPSSRTPAVPSLSSTASSTTPRSSRLGGESYRRHVAEAKRKPRPSAGGLNACRSEFPRVLRRATPSVSTPANCARVAAARSPPPEGYRGAAPPRLT